jgi:D-lactate dehydrogenase
MTRINTRIAVFSTKKWVRDSFDGANPDFGFQFTYFEPRLGPDTAKLAADHDAVCAFVNDDISAPVLDVLAGHGIRLIAMRCAGFNNVDIRHAKALGITVVRVPAYSPYAVAEHTLGLILALNRRYHRSYTRVRDGNFSLDGLLGFDVHGKTVGIIGTGRIGQVLASLLSGFGTTILAHDKFRNDEWAAASGATYVELEQLYRESDIISLHCPLTHETYHLINKFSINSMKPGVMLINTSRGPLINSDAVIDGLKSHQIGYLGLDVYEEESSLFFEDLSDEVIQDDTFVRLQTFPNVLITAHQAFFTKEAVDNIAATTLQNIRDVTENGSSDNEVREG